MLNQPRLLHRSRPHHHYPILPARIIGHHTWPILKLFTVYPAPPPFRETIVKSWHANDHLEVHPVYRRSSYHRSFFPLLFKSSVTMAYVLKSPNSWQ